MISLLLVLTFFNLLGLIYVVWLIYRKYRFFSSSTSAATPSDFSHHQFLKIGLIRYNPFDDLGGDQSFVLCFLDSQNSGVIITSLHSRHQTRVYAKEVINGQTSGLTLSPEEKQLLNQTLKKHVSKT